MIDATEKALLDAGVRPDRVHTERFTSPTLETLTPEARQAAVGQRNVFLHLYAIGAGWQRRHILRP